MAGAGVGQLQNRAGVPEGGGGVQGAGLPLGVPQPVQGGCGHGGRGRGVLRTGAVLPGPRRRGTGAAPSFEEPTALPYRADGEGRQWCCWFRPVLAEHRPALAGEVFGDVGPIQAFIAIRNRHRQTPGRYQQKPSVRGAIVLEGFWAGVAKRRRELDLPPRNRYSSDSHPTHHSKRHPASS
jgi:hypothetical protein